MPPAARRSNEASTARASRPTREAGAERRELSGWGRSPVSVADVVAPEVVEEVPPIIARARRSGGSVLARGLGRSYGDAAQAAGATVVDLTACRSIFGHDPETPTVHVEAGLSLEDLIAWAVPKGYFVPVTPGTRQVTVGGAIAADVHGKNHHRDGSFGRYVRSMRLATPGGVRTLSPSDDEAVFWATVGGMGLTGVVLDAEIQLLRIETAQMSVDTDRARDLDECMSIMTEGDADYPYSVAWVDCLATGKAFGRSVLTRGRHATLEQLEAAARRRPGANAGGRAGADPLEYRVSQLVDVPIAPPFRLPQREFVRLFNEAWFRKAPRRRREELQTIPAFFHPLDGIGGWNRLYGRRGFLQYQFVVPFGAEEVVRRVIEELASARTPSLLAVLKRFGPSDPAPLSFPAPGWTLALDLPLGLAALGEALDRFDEWVADAGGRIYFAKDSRVHPRHVPRMYPRLDEWREVLDRVDPGHTITSDLSRRLQLRRAGRQTHPGETS
jgi:decaprenylphospho-beta-D-ribofuranose 2-oxidase